MCKQAPEKWELSPLFGIIRRNNQWSETNCKELLFADIINAGRKSGHKYSDEQEVGQLHAYVAQAIKI